MFFVVVVIPKIRQTEKDHERQATSSLSVHNILGASDPLLLTVQSINQLIKLLCFVGLSVLLVFFLCATVVAIAYHPFCLLFVVCGNISNRYRRK